ncbi:uncharacterized protein TNCT_163991 [Trichonephila clavata]|uniref:Uncharacterized protein n=1 Tax=Trichonephila clavata TaxID=2740835 RepID=A0A8X6FBK3_TRICU|nr:uncharacterized protein TNCT_163991 [Trichonephila clavata]
MAKDILEYLNLVTSTVESVPFHKDVEKMKINVVDILKNLTSSKSYIEPKNVSTENTLYLLGTPEISSSPDVFNMSKPILEDLNLITSTIKSASFHKEDEKMKIHVVDILKNLTSSKSHPGSKNVSTEETLYNLNIPEIKSSPDVSNDMAKAILEYLNLVTSTIESVPFHKDEEKMKINVVDILKNLTSSKSYIEPKNVSTEHTLYLLGTPEISSSPDVFNMSKPILEDLNLITSTIKSASFHKEDEKMKIHVVDILKNLTSSKSHPGSKNVSTEGTLYNLKIPEITSSPDVSNDMAKAILEYLNLVTSTVESVPFHKDVEKMKINVVDILKNLTSSKSHIEPKNVSTDHTLYLLETPEISSSPDVFNMSKPILEYLNLITPTIKSASFHKDDEKMKVHVVDILKNLTSGKSYPETQNVLTEAPLYLLETPKITSSSNVSYDTYKIILDKYLNLASSIAKSASLHKEDEKMKINVVDIPKNLTSSKSHPETKIVSSEDTSHHLETPEIISSSNVSYDTYKIILDKFLNLASSTAKSVSLYKDNEKMKITVVDILKNLTSSKDHLESKNVSTEHTLYLLGAPEITSSPDVSNIPKAILEYLHLITSTTKSVSFHKDDEKVKINVVDILKNLTSSKSHLESKLLSTEDTLNHFETPKTTSSSNVSYDMYKAILDKYLNLVPSTAKSDSFHKDDENMKLNVVDMLKNLTSSISHPESKFVSTGISLYHSESPQITSKPDVSSDYPKIILEKYFDLILSTIESASFREDEGKMKLNVADILKNLTFSKSHPESILVATEGTEMKKGVFVTGDTESNIINAVPEVLQPVTMNAVKTDDAVFTRGNLKFDIIPKEDTPFQNDFYIHENEKNAEGEPDFSHLKFLETENQDNTDSLSGVSNWNTFTDQGFVIRTGINNNENKKSGLIVNGSHPPKLKGLVRIDKIPPRFRFKDAKNAKKSHKSFKLTKVVKPRKRSTTSKNRFEAKVSTESGMSIEDLLSLNKETEASESTQEINTDSESKVSTESVKSIEDLLSLNKKTEAPESTQEINIDSEAKVSTEPVMSIEDILSLNKKTDAPESSLEINIDSESRVSTVLMRSIEENSKKQTPEGSSELFQIAYTFSPNKRDLIVPESQPEVSVSEHFQKFDHAPETGKIKNLIHRNVFLTNLLSLLSKKAVLKKDLDNHMSNLDDGAKLLETPAKHPYLAGFVLGVGIVAVFLIFSIALYWIGFKKSKFQTKDGENEYYQDTRKRNGKGENSKSLSNFYNFTIL